MQMPLDRRSDIFSLGTTLWELLTSRRLFRRDSDIDTVRAVQLGPIPDPRSVAPEVPEELARIARTALERNRDHRYPSAAYLARELDAFVSTRCAPGDITARITQLVDTLFPGEHKRQSGWLKPAITSSISRAPGSVSTTPRPGTVSRPMPPEVRRDTRETHRRSRPRHASLCRPPPSLTASPPSPPRRARPARRCRPRSRPLPLHVTACPRCPHRSHRPHVTARPRRPPRSHRPHVTARPRWNLPRSQPLHVMACPRCDLPRLLPRPRSPRVTAFRRRLRRVRPGRRHRKGRRTLLLHRPGAIRPRRRSRERRSRRSRPPPIRGRRSSEWRRRSRLQPRSPRRQRARARRPTARAPRARRPAVRSGDDLYRSARRFPCPRARGPTRGSRPNRLQRCRPRGPRAHARLWSRRLRTATAPRSTCPSRQDQDRERSAPELELSYATREAPYAYAR